MLDFRFSQHIKNNENKGTRETKLQFVLRMIIRGGALKVDKLSERATPTERNFELKGIFLIATPDIPDVHTGNRSRSAFYFRSRKRSAMGSEGHINPNGKTQTEVHLVLFVYC